MFKIVNLRSTSFPDYEAPAEDRIVVVAVSKVIICTTIPNRRFIILTRIAMYDTDVQFWMFPGLGGGAFALVAPLYISECSEARLRGGLASMLQVRPLTQDLFFFAFFC